MSDHTSYIEEPLTYPSGKIWIICFPSIKDELWRIEAGLTLLSETASSLSYIIFVKAASHAVRGICVMVVRSMSGQNMVETARDEPECGT